QKWYIGKEDFAGEVNTNALYRKLADKLANEGKTIVYVGNKEEVIAIYALKDTIREEAKAAITALKKRGIYTIMLTGDNELTAKAIAEEAGINDYVAECLPDEKVKYMKKLKEQYGSVAMVG